ncbi:MAG: tetratricopeptide repeat protein [Deltaproteobacteria bacterium]|nr:MAG: tetratricopeptide repeat protein [Deltaproteobacteria bacterium]
MQSRRLLSRVVLLMTIIFLTACAAGMESYRQGDDLSRMGNWEGAIAFYKDALAKEPNNKKYQEALNKAQQEAAKEHYQVAVDIWTGSASKDYPTVTRAMASLDTAKEFDPANAKVLQFYRQLEAKKQELANLAKHHYEQGIQALNKAQWLQAVTDFRKVTEIYPNYEDTEDKLARAVMAGSNEFYNQGIAAVQSEDWKTALTAFNKVVSINPTYKNTRKLVEEVKKNNNPQYFLGRAAELASAKEWDQAIRFYQVALSYIPGDPAVQSLLAKTKLEAGSYYFNLANQHSIQDRLYRANQEFQKAISYSPSLANSFFFKESLKNHCNKLFQRAFEYAGESKYGNALAWYWQLNQVNPQYPELFFKVQETEDAVRKRLKKAIAVFDFSSPSYDPDAGTTASSNLITYLFNNSSGDIRILERQDLQSILKEMNLEQAGIVGDMEAARRVGRMTGIDIFIMGSVLLYKTETDESRGSKVAKIQVGTKVQDNPDYLIWKAKHPKPSEKELAAAPPAVVQVPEYRYENYAVGRNKMRAAFHVYYKIIDAKRGEIIATDTIKRDKEVSDDWNDGIPEADVAFDSLELPTESELLEEVTAEVVRDLALVVMKPFQSLQTTYFEEAKTLVRRRHDARAVEKYVDAIYDERIKGINSPISKQAMENINQLISTR